MFILKEAYVNGENQLDYLLLDARVKITEYKNKLDVLKLKYSSILTVKDYVEKFYSYSREIDKYYSGLNSYNPDSDKINELITNFNNERANLEYSLLELESLLKYLEYFKILKNASDKGIISKDSNETLNGFYKYSISEDKIIVESRHLQIKSVISIVNILDEEIEFILKKMKEVK